MRHHFDQRSPPRKTPAPDHSSLQSSTTGALYTDSTSRAPVASTLSLSLTPYTQPFKLDYDTTTTPPTVILPKLSILAARAAARNPNIFSPEWFSPTSPGALPTALARIVYRALHGFKDISAPEPEPAAGRGRGIRWFASEVEKVPENAGNWVSFARDYGVGTYKDEGDEGMSFLLP